MLLTAGTLTACYATAKAALVAAGLLRLARVAALHAVVLATILGVALLPACLLAPQPFTLYVRLLARAGAYGGLFALFAASLRPGRQPLITRIARRVDPVFTPKRLAYTHGVTWLWSTYFAAQFLATFVLPLVPAGPWSWLIAVSDLPLAAALLALELAFRQFHFRGQPHGSVRATLSSLRHADLAPETPHTP